MLYSEVVLYCHNCNWEFYVLSDVAHFSNMIVWYNVALEFRLKCVGSIASVQTPQLFIVNVTAPSPFPLSLPLLWYYVGLTSLCHWTCCCPTVITCCLNQTIIKLQIINATLNLEIELKCANTILVSRWHSRVRAVTLTGQQHQQDVWIVSPSRIW